MKTSALVLKGGGEGDLEALEERKRILDLKWAANKASLCTNGHLGALVKNSVLCAVVAATVILVGFVFIP